MTSLTEFVSYLSRETKWHGDHNENDSRLILNAGDLSMVFENGNLRYISLKNHEIIRMIYSAVRDKEWLTVCPVISDEEFELQPESFRIKFKAHYLSGEINFLALYSIIGNSDNSLIFSFEGEAIADFEKNRIGFCLLHPIEGNKGENCKIVHSNNEEENLFFPLLISPHQPFNDIKSMRWKKSGTICAIDFFGDVFETEDQRNWTDASFKTYCTPLERPFPVKIHTGEKIYQKIVLKVESGEQSETHDSGQISISINRAKVLPVPMIGIGQSTRLQPLTAGEIKIFHKLRFDHYRVDLYLFNNDWRNKGDLAFNEALLLDYKIELAIFLDDDYRNQIRLFIKWLTGKKVDPAIILLYHKRDVSLTDFYLEEIALLLYEAISGVKIGLGTNANFAQLNRNRPKSGYSDYICYSIHPQEHASDDSTLVENLQSQRYTVESAMEFSHSRKIWVSPVNIQRRFNSNTTNYEPSNDGVNFPSQADSRLMSLFGACWTAGSLKYLFEGGIKGVTLLETVGERGIIQGDFNSRWPNEFQSFKGMIFPVYFVLKFILGNKSFGTIESISSHPLNVDSMVISVANHLKMILVNYTREFQSVIINGCQGEFSTKRLSEETYNYAVTDAGWLENSETKTVRLSEPLLLEPFSVTFIEG